MEPFILIKKKGYLLTIISSPSSVARQSDPATLVAIFSRGKVIMGKPAHNISVPVVCALHKGLKKMKITNIAEAI